SFTTKERTPWADEGYEVARVQLPLDAGSPEVKPVPLAAVPKLSYEDGAERITVRGDKGLKAVIDKSTGLLTTFEAGGTALLLSGAVPNFWRAPTDNDRGNGQHTRNQTWRDAGARRTVEKVTARPLGDGRAVTVTVEGTLPTSTKSAYSTVYTVFGNGEIKVD
ncbi:beta-galactosidase, partial [Streptomyces sp. SID11233]|nr:beta-galactosidase [Streptomyces sp. SID11233]